MATPFKFVSSVNTLVGTIPPDGIISRTLYNDDQVKVTLFGFAAGQSLSEHTAAQPAVLHFIRGVGHLTLAEKEKRIQVGTWVHVAAGLPHSIVAVTELVMVLTLFKAKAAD